MIRGGLSRDPRANNVESELYSIKDENLNLKRHLNAQEDKTKKLLTKVQRLTDDLRKTNPQSNSRASATSYVRTRDDTETAASIQEMRQQMQQTTKANTQLRNKAQFFKSLHEAEVRKRAPYDHIPPRINTGIQRKMYPAINIQKKYVNEVHDTHSHEEVHEDIQKLEDLVHVLRGKLIDVEQELHDSRSKFDRLHEDHTNIQQRQDVDRLSLQKEIVEKNKRIQTSNQNYDALDEKYRALIEANSDALQAVQDLNMELKAERMRSLNLEASLRESDNEKHKNEELICMLNDARAEKDLYESEYNNLLNHQFSTDREQEFSRELEELRKSNSELEREIQQYIKEKSGMLTSLKELSGFISRSLFRENLKQAQHDKEYSDSRMIELQSRLEELQAKLRDLTQNGEIDLNELEEALAIVRLRREKGIPLDFLIQIDELIDEKRLLQELRLQYAECIQELEKTHKLLMLQEIINKDYKIEVESLIKKMAALKNEYELRLEENSRLLDARSSKVANLEAQLRDILYSTIKLPAEKIQADRSDSIVLEHGQNLLEVHIDAAVISAEGRIYMKKLGLESGDDSLSGEVFTTFIYFNFFEFETQITPLGIGSKPHYNHTSRYEIIIFISRDTKFSLTISFYSIYKHRRWSSMFAGQTGLTISLLEYVSFKELVEKDSKSMVLQYYADIVDINDQKTVLGKIDFSLRLRIPISQSIQAYKERTVALNLLSVSQSPQNEAAMKRFGLRANVNELLIHVQSCTGLIPPLESHPSVYFCYDFYQYEDIISETIRGSTSPVFNFIKTLLLPMTSDLDRYLKTSHLNIVVLDDCSIDQKDYLYGVVKIPLANLVSSGILSGEFEIRDEYGFKRGTMALTLEWSKPYKAECSPIISRLDISTNGNEHDKVFHYKEFNESSDQSNEKAMMEIMTNVVLTPNMIDSSRQNKSQKRDGNYPSNTPDITSNGAAILNKTASLERYTSFNEQSSVERYKKFPTIRMDALNNISSHDLNQEKSESSIGKARVGNGYEKEITAKVTQATSFPGKSNGPHRSQETRSRSVERKSKEINDFADNDAISQVSANLFDSRSLREDSVSGMSNSYLGLVKALAFNNQSGIIDQSFLSNDYERATQFEEDFSNYNNVAKDYPPLKDSMIISNDLNDDRLHNADRSTGSSPAVSYCEGDGQTSDADLPLLSESKPHFDAANVAIRSISSQAENGQSEAETSEFMFTITAKKLIFDLSSRPVQIKLEPVKQIFIGYSFLDFAPDELESNSMAISQKGTCKFNFTRALYITHQRMQPLRKMLKSTNPIDSVVVFYVVCEPPAGEVSECIDIAISELHLHDLIEGDGDSQIIQLPVWDIDGEVLMGSMEICIGGCHALQKL